MSTLGEVWQEQRYVIDGWFADRWPGSGAGPALVAAELSAAGIHFARFWALLETDGCGHDWIELRRDDGEFIASIPRDPARGFEHVGLVDGGEGLFVRLVGGVELHLTRVDPDESEQVDQAKQEA